MIVDLSALDSGDLRIAVLGVGRDICSQFRPYSRRPVWLFGSVARSSARVDSDVDLLVDDGVSSMDRLFLAGRLELMFGRTFDVTPASVLFRDPDPLFADNFLHDACRLRTGRPISAKELQGVIRRTARAADRGE